jgi:acetylornithine deacetylase
LWIELHIVGKAAHGSRPHLGVDAIVKTGPILVALEELNQRLRARQHPSLGAGSVHASIIAGGHEEATIPGHCVLTLERRTLPGETTADVEGEIADLLARCRAHDPDLVATYRTTLARDPLETNPSAPVVATLCDAGERVLGRPLDMVGVTYWADSAFISAAGIPTVLFGSAGDGMHADVEWADLPSTIACTRVLTAAAVAFCR